MSETPTPIEAARKIGAEGGPTVEAERLAFEAWMEGHCWSLDYVFWTGAQYLSPAERDGIVDAYAVQIRRMWAAWRDRAALAADALTAERAARERAEAAHQEIVDYVMGHFPVGLCFASPLQAIQVVASRMTRAEAERDALAEALERIRPYAEQEILDCAADIQEGGKGAGLDDWSGVVAALADQEANARDHDEFRRAAIDAARKERP